MRSAAARNSLAAAGEGFHRELLPADLSGRKVLVVGDQGLGDELFFLRFVGRLRERGAFVAYCPDPRLAAMLWRAGVADEIAQGEPAAGAHDYRVSAGDLPWLTGFADEDPLPPSIVLSPHPKHLVDVRDRLARFGAGPYIGVTWRAGSAGARRLLFKEAPAHELADMLAGVQGSVVIVQRAPAEGEVEAFAHALGRPVLDLSALNADLEATLALCGLLDAYVAVSNTNVHLRAACGMTSNVLVPFPPEFRWMATGDESPWFAGTPLYRQQPDASWEKAFSDLACDLKSVRPLLEAAG